MSLLKTMFGVGTRNTSGIRRVSASEFSKYINGKSVQLIDVRTPLEFKGGHLKNARNIDFFQWGTFVQKINKYDKNKPIYLYCRSGNRSLRAAKRLLKLGFTEIYDLKGGYLNWNHSPLNSRI